MTWVRHGECNRCGDCCKAPHFEDKGGGDCKWLRDGNVCSVHKTQNEFWNNVCTHWPRHPSEIEKLTRCSYWFEWVDDDEPPPIATQFGIVIDTKIGAVVRIFNPDYEYEFFCHHVAPHELMYRIDKASSGISLDKNGMTLIDVARLLEQYGGRP